MSNKSIGSENIKALIIQHAIYGAGTKSIARSMRIARSTVRAYIKMYRKSNLVEADILNLSATNIAISLRPQKNIYENAGYALLRDLYSQYYKRLENVNTNLKKLWQEYRQNEPSGLKYSRFVARYHKWRQESGFADVHFNKWKLKDISKEDEKTLRKWRLSNKRDLWERAVALLDLQRDGNIAKISKKIERSCKTIKRWHAAYLAKGTESLNSHRIREGTEQRIDNIVAADILNLSATNIVISIRPQKNIGENAGYALLRDLYSQYYKRIIKNENANLKTLWQEYSQNESTGLKYSQFVARYHKWRKENGFANVRFNKWKLKDIRKEDQKTFREWRLSNKRSKWDRAVALLDLYKEGNIAKISRKIERSPSTIKRWHSVYVNKGTESLDLHPTREVPDQIKENIRLKNERIIKLIHESPSLHDINRTSWSLHTLEQVYDKIYNETISMTTISEYIRSEGYTFKKARIVLTSPDPEYRTKLNKITTILSNLKPNEKFFSIDEFGPVAIKIRGGRAFSPKDQMRTIPQLQKSKGSLICTAALELSTNQVTHFYSSKKNTTEMIKLLEILINNYTTEERIFFSWDAASWHASKKLYERIVEVNDPEYRNKHSTPLVELAPLPSSAHFLNIIESVFSGMAKAIIHNSDYQSIDECKLAIDRYFSERNEAFLENPKRAGKKIWGAELVKPIFKENNNCKDPKYR